MHNQRNTSIHVCIPITQVRANVSNCAYASAGILVTGMLVNNIYKIYECIIKEIQVFMYASP